MRFAAPSGAATLSLDNRDGLAVGGGDVLCLDRGTGIAEFITTKSVQATLTPDEPAEVELVFSLRHGHGPGAPVDVAAVSVPTMTRTFRRAPIAGDAVIFLSSIAGWTGASTIEISGGGATEYHSISRFEATTDTEGFYRLPPISRAAVLKFEVKGTAISDEFSIDYSKPINPLDFSI